ncbi:MAG TPA: ABC transporter ATP-binding protein [Chloroflexota bacterium]|jgi:NitT/TauT family transport system ATP-binding protein|nr:ABC transporter ATP-binding protein [Chloroflexota bacterium]
MVGAATHATGATQARGVRLEVRHLTHRFTLKQASLLVLDDVSVSAAPGAFVALVGPSGCGKSTLLRILAGLEQPTLGGMSVDGRPIDGPHPACALVFQDPTLFPWRTVWQNVALGPEARGQRVKKDDPHVQHALELVGLAAFAHAYPSQLSGGMAQRVALARVLVNEPSLLLLDEPLGQLDALTRLTMQRELLRLWEAGGFTALLVTHDVDEALFLSDRVIVLSARPGRILGEVAVDVPRPRHHDDPQLQALRKRVLTLLGFDWL